jgi:Icc-related predicted phosphoesterase
LRIVAISDTHERHDGLVVPDGDVLVHAGDFTGRGTFPAIAKFADWMRALSHAHKVVIAGNHELTLEDISDLKSPRYMDDTRRLPKGQDTTSKTIAVRLLVDAGLTYLEDSSTIIRRLKFYGSPWTPAFNNWAFNLDRGSRGMLDVRAKIPSDVEVLITHGPPFGILDSTVDAMHQGCVALERRVFHLPAIKACIFGHLHRDGGQTRDIHGVKFVNAAICDDAYRPIHPIQVIDI